ncbi:MAG TPA: bifunctional riboflavin kinase/FAD synthetase, partial [Thermodesulfobacteriota bacterium]|nr:bifunctional riboflavin kinase/FAD synthetase [Thermodesulfobacteriota bacterium]
IGNFDGVHLGHKKILSAVRETAERKGLSSCVITFHPHPQKVLRNIDIPLLMPIRERLKLLESEGMDFVACYTFTEDISKIPAKDFISDILVGRLKVKHLIIGPDFSFGRKREGNAELLETMGNVYDFETSVIGPVYIGGEVVSSTAIRNLLKAGDAKKAASFLGYNYYIEGEVTEGEKRGRQIGYPTANLATDWEMLPKAGVYATRACLGDTKLDSITNIGYRPTFGSSKLLIETHIFDFNSDIYGKRLRIEFVERIRDEKRFESVDALVTEIRADVEKVRKILENSE